MGRESCLVEAVTTTRWTIAQTALRRKRPLKELPDMQSYGFSFDCTAGRPCVYEIPATAAASGCVNSSWGVFRGWKKSALALNVICFFKRHSSAHLDQREAQRLAESLVVFRHQPPPHTRILKITAIKCAHVKTKYWTCRKRRKKIPA